MKRMPSVWVTMAYMDSLMPSDEVQVPSHRHTGLYAAGAGFAADGAPPAAALLPGVAPGDCGARVLPAVGGAPVLTDVPPFAPAEAPPALAGEAAPLPEQAPIKKQEERINNE